MKVAHLILGHDCEVITQWCSASAACPGEALMLFLQPDNGEEPGAPWRNASHNPHGPKPAVEGRGHLQHITGVDLTAIEGVDDTTTLRIISESGLDMRRWPTVQYVASWWGTPKAITATAHQCSRLIDTMLRHGTADNGHRMNEYAHRSRVGTPWTRRAQALVYSLVETPQGAPA